MNFCLLLESHVMKSLEEIPCLNEIYLFAFSLRLNLLLNDNVSEDVLNTCLIIFNILSESV